MDQSLEPESSTILSGHLCKCYEGIAFDCRFFYLTLPSENKIFKFSREFIFIKYYEARRPYAAITFDSIENCFWASDERTRDIIFKLDGDFREIGQIKISHCCAEDSYICSLSHNCENDTILVAYENCILEVPKEGNPIRILQQSDCSIYLGVLSIPPYHVVIQSCRRKQSIDIFLEDQLIKNCCIFDSSEHQIKDLAFVPCCDDGRQTIVLVILAEDSCKRPCLLKCVLDFCGMKLNDCNFICCCRQGGCSCDVVESIARAECALAHILNAEGEKLQKAVEIADNICELLEINQSVNKTITKITFLEQVLYAKLEAVSDGKACDICKGQKK